MQVLKLRFSIHVSVHVSLKVPMNCGQALFAQGHSSHTPTATPAQCRVHQSTRHTFEDDITLCVCFERYLASLDQ